MVLLTYGNEFKMALAFVNIFMANIKKEILSQRTYEPLVWKRFIDDVFSLWEITKGEVELTLLSRQISFIHYQIYG